MGTSELPVLGSMDGTDPRRDITATQQRGLFVVDRAANEGALTVSMSCTRGRLNVLRVSPSVSSAASVVRTANLFDPHARISRHFLPTLFD